MQDKEHVAPVVTRRALSDHHTIADREDRLARVAVDRPLPVPVFTWMEVAPRVVQPAQEVSIRVESGEDVPATPLRAHNRTRWIEKFSKPPRKEKSWVA